MNRASAAQAPPPRPPCHLRRDEQGQRRERQLERALWKGVRERDSREDAERREDPDDEAVAKAHVAVTALALGADDRHGNDGQERGRLRSKLGLRQEHRERGDEQDPATDAKEPADGAAGEAHNRCEHVIHQGTINSTAMTTSRSAKRAATVRSEIRCCSAVPAITPPTAGTPTKRPLAMSTLP